MPQTVPALQVPLPANDIGIAPPSRRLPAQRLDVELGQRGQFCGVLYVARQLRLTAVDLRTVVTHIRAHIDQGGFPHPVSSRLRGGRVITGAAAVTPKSEWLRAAVDVWIAQRYFGDATGTAANPDRAALVEATLQARFQGKGA